MREIIGVVVDHERQVGVAPRKGDRTTGGHVKVTGNFADFYGAVIPVGTYARLKAGF